MVKHDVLRDFMKQSEIMTHFMESTRLIDEFHEIIILRCFFILWMQPNTFNEKWLRIILEQEYHDREEVDDKLARFKAYKELYITYIDDDYYYYKINNKTYKVIRKYEEYDYYLKYKNWWDVIHIYEEIPKFMKWFNDRHYLKLKDLSNLFLDSKHRSQDVTKENQMIKLRKDNNVNSNYWFFLIFKCFIVQVHEWYKIFDAFEFGYTKEYIQGLLNSMLENGFISEELLLELIKNINI